MKNAIPFESPSSLLVELSLPRERKIKGMGLKKGITLIVGGGYHGKSTLLNAIEAGVYNHIKGDGREYVITNDTAVKLRAEAGRGIKNADISLFINDLPNKKRYTLFLNGKCQRKYITIRKCCRGYGSRKSAFPYR